jgi:hypothetical protein
VSSQSMAPPGAAFNGHKGGHRLEVLPQLLEALRHATDELPAVTASAALLLSTIDDALAAFDHSVEMARAHERRRNRMRSES